MHKIAIPLSAPRFIALIIRSTTLISSHFTLPSAQWQPLKGIKNFSI